MKVQKVDKNAGFTLIELLVAILILGILSTAVLIAINPQQRIAQANDAKRKSDLKQIANALEAYRVKESVYPTPCTQFGTGICTSASGGSNWIPGLVENDFLKSIPEDPKDDDPKNASSISVYGDHLTYFYISETAYGGAGGDYFILGAWFENEGDPHTLQNLGDRPMWPDCTSDIGFSDTMYILRSYSCPGDPPGAL